MPEPSASGLRGGRTKWVMATLAAAAVALTAGGAAAPGALAATGEITASHASLATGSVKSPMGSVFVDGSGLADIAVQGPHHSLLLYWATPGSAWNEQTVAGPGTTYSDPSIFVRSAAPAGEADIVAEGPHHSLLYYYAAGLGSPWTATEVAGPGSTYSAPSIYVRDVAPLGEADIVAEGPDHSLYYEWARVGGSWNRDQVAGPGSTYQ